MDTTGKDGLIRHIGASKKAYSTPSLDDWYKEDAGQVKRGLSGTWLRRMNCQGWEKDVWNLEVMDEDAAESVL